MSEDSSVKRILVNRCCVWNVDTEFSDGRIERASFESEDDALESANAVAQRSNCKVLYA